MDQYNSILKWAAGVTIPPPKELQVEIADLLALVDAHNLSGRFIRRIRAQHLNWQTQELVDGLEQLHRETRQQVNRNVMALWELSRDLPDTRVILIKGISTYILSGDEQTMRAGDIDVLSNNPAQVVQTLINLGYVQTRAPFMHEIGEFTKGAAEFDIHDHFPVHSYTDSLLQSDLIPQHHLGIWPQSYKGRHSTITFADLEQSAHCGKQPHVVHVVVPDPNLLALIISAHAFMNYTNMWSISHRQKPCVRLSEIADLFSLARHPSFSPERFLGYVEYYQAFDAVEWAASIAVSLFGQNPLPVPASIGFGDPLPATRFPRCLWWTFWASLSSATDELLGRWWLPMDWLTDQVGTNHFFLPEHEEKYLCTLQQEDAILLGRCISQSSDPIPMRLYVKRHGTSISLRLQVLTNWRASVERIRIDLGNSACEWLYVKDSQECRQVGSQFQSSLTQEEAGYQLSTELSWKELGLSNPSDQAISLLVGVARQRNANEPAASTLVPLTIQL